MVKRGTSNVPVIGVAKAGWKLDQFKARAQRQPGKARRRLDPQAFDQARVAAALRRRRLRRRGDVPGAPQGARQPRSVPRTISPSRRCCSARSSSSWRRRAAPPAPASSSRSRSATISTSARELNAILLAHLRRRRTSSASTTTWASGPVHNMRVLPLRQRVPRTVLEPQLRRERADHHGRELRRPGPRRVLRPDRHRPRRDPEPPVPGAGESRDGAAGAHRQRVDARREGEGAEGDSAARGREHGARVSSAATCRSLASRPIRRSRHSPRCGSRSTIWRWQGVPFYIRAGKSLPVTCTEVLVRLKRPPRVFPTCKPTPQLFALSHQSR